MRICNFVQGGVARLGVVAGEGVIDLSLATPLLPRELGDLLRRGPRALEQIRLATATASPHYRLADVSLAAPVARPGKFLAVGLNYADHIAEIGAKTPDFPSTFAKLNTCINGPYAEVHRPRVSDSLDYEGELGFVIGRRCRHAPSERAAEAIAGYFVVNDFTTRAWVHKTPQVVIPKSFDTHGPFGPWLTTADEVGDPQNLAIRTLVNGELRQNSNTRQMTFGCAELVHLLSQAVTLEPGDVITTGTPHGVGEGFTPKRYLKPGDVVRVEIEKLGHIENRIVDEPASTGVW